MLQDELARRSPQRATPQQLAESLGWDSDLVKRVVDRAEQDPGSSIRRGRGGVVKFTGTERGDSLLYTEVSRILRDYWAPRGGLRPPAPEFSVVEIVDTAQSGHRDGFDWVHPDRVMRALPARRTDPKLGPDIHTFEIERPNGCRIASVFQAFVQGRGSDFSWLICHRNDLGTGAQCDRMFWALKRTDVGLITYTQPGSWTTWEQQRKAGRRQYTRSERADFCRLAFNDEPWR